MPYVNIRITAGATDEQKAELIAGATDLLVRVLNKNPAATFVVIDEVPFVDLEDSACYFVCVVVAWGDNRVMSLPACCKHVGVGDLDP